MTLRGLVRALGSAVLLFVVASMSVSPANAAGKSEPKGKKSAARAEKTPDDLFRRDLPDPPGPGTIPDDTVVLQIGDKKYTAKSYVLHYFSAYPADRPGQDSLGRVQFMRALIHKDLLSREARRINKPLGFEDRQTLREHTARVYSNVLYQRAAVDPVQVEDQEVRDAYELFKVEVRLRHILFAGRETAERVRRDLVSGRIGWNLAVQQYSIGEKAEAGDLGWQSAGQIGLGMASVTHRLRPGEYSTLIRNSDGWSLMQCMERREVKAPMFEALQRLIRGQLETAKTNVLADAIQDTLVRQIGLEVDSTNVRWAVKLFPSANTYESQSGTLNIDASLPEVAPEDTSRVLARFRGGQVTLGSFLHEYGHIPSLIRPNVNEFGLLARQVISTALTPYTVTLAIERGLDRDPAAVKMVEHKLDELLVEHLYQDSVMSHVWVRPSEMRSYYERNRHKFVTFPVVTFAAITRSSRAGIDSVTARIRAGESAAAILRADSLAGHVSGSIQSRQMNDEGRPYHRVIFEELRPGQFSVEGPDPSGDYLVIQVLTRDDGRQYTFEESAMWVEQALQAEHAERALNALLIRLASGLEIRWRPDFVMRTDFRDRDAF